MKLRDSLSEIDRRFGQDAIDFVTLKGVMLSSRLYPSPDLRQQYDLDILVRQRDLQRSLSSLRALGFCLKRNRKSITSNKSRTEYAVALPRRDCKVDVHWRLRGFPACRIEEHPIFATARETDFNGGCIRTLSDEYMLTLLMLSIAADLGGGVCRLKHWLDLYLAASALRHEIDWALFFQTREREGVLSLCVNVLSLLRQLFAHDERLSWIDDVLLPFRGLICVSGTRRATALVFARRGAISNAMWLLQTYPSIGWRELVWFLDRKLPHPGRIPTAGFRSVRLELGNVKMRPPVKALKSTVHRLSKPQRKHQRSLQPHSAT